MAQMWAFRCYRSERGIDEIRAWYDRQTPKVRGKFLSRLKSLGQFQPHEWVLPYFRWLHGECEGIGEVRFEVMRVQHRPLGFQDQEWFSPWQYAQERRTIVSSLRMPARSP